MERAGIRRSGLKSPIRRHTHAKTAMPPAIPQPLTLWRLVDGKPGHEKQTLGLAQALGRLTDCRRIDIPALVQHIMLKKGVHP
ncbi:MAG: hypothetical protein HGA75_16620, partial [Thiobacillus sp.]|nr:hypothetical protein [Thiobacillus sp.]